MVKSACLSRLSLVYFALSGLYELSPVNRKRFGSSAIICKPVTNFPWRLHLAKLQGWDLNPQCQQNFALRYPSATLLKCLSFQAANSSSDTIGWKEMFNQ